MSRAEDADLISEVEKFTWLYERKNKHFKNKQMRENAWKTIAGGVNLTAGGAEQRFNQLRNRYNTEKRKLKVTHSGMEEDGNPTWYLYEAMQFLDKFIVPRKTYGNIQPDNSISTCTMLQTTEPPLSPKWDTMSQIWFPPQTPEDTNETSNNTQSETSNNTQSETLGGTLTATQQSSCPELQTETSTLLKKHTITEAATRGVLTRQVNTFAERQQNVEEDEEDFFGKTLAKSLQRICNRKNRARARIAVLEILEQYESDNM